ncbi:hypothetical protein CTEN210_10685 [Chaetoceros tenuissimus]|uniref:Calcium/calmodulin-dependent protein kinase II association-domain domain-containing protein n=1 Tax=Chaetoceros tenuissimus TaxID=426638 RepID=A0AAD3D154_9STRA|nr:hypothetical protein CTEN210_10685 [Chaetoceros tenuissimus]
MKFAPVTFALALCSHSASAFAPRVAPAIIGRPISNAVRSPVVRVDSSSLNLFRKNGKFRRALRAATKGGDSDVTEERVRSLFNLWNAALATEDSRIVASLYAKEPVLLPTVSDLPRTDFDLVKDYFDAFLQKKPQGKIIESHVNIGEDFASDTGIYEFTMGATGDKVKARYTFLYTKENEVWKIQHHHSSAMPEEVMGTAITDDEVRDLFHLWNDALATLEPKKVADRYAKKGVLLPTVSDVPRTDYDGIEDYFTNFLKLEPQGEILESNVVKGVNWAQDCGIYEFTMGATGKKVKGRYSFIYVYEDGEWKISHHHSSIMPEGIVTAEPITEDEVRDLFGLWNDALATEDPEKVAARYSKQGVLLPTVSDVPRTDNEGIVDYFTNFLKLKPQGEIQSGNIIVGTNWAQDAGIYEFTMGANNNAKVKGRYTFVYVYEDGEWKISQHHSSVMPEEQKAQPITEDEVRDLFQLWNNALATEDPDAVAKRYSKDAVLLPTVSDVPRTDYDLIKDYFVGFLKKKPQGEILESNVTIGHNWAQDAGIYEFTMGATGDKVKGRYSFVYVYEDNQWKISHHHSSVMPEAFLGEAPKPNVGKKEAVEA